MVAPANTFQLESPVQLLPIDAIVESGTNPRRHFDKTKMSELVESVRQHGIYQPVLVRYAVTDPTDRRPVHYELVFGARRYRAAKELSLTGIPAIVRAMSDLEVLEAQIIENSQREDVHPLEEADGYQALHTKHGKSVEEIANAVGKSKAYIYGRMRLVGLCANARDAFYAGSFDVSVALLIARLGAPTVQEEATARLLSWREGQITYADAKTELERSFMLDLARAPFEVEDATLLPAAGACGLCPKRAGNQRDLFGDVANGDTCTDPGCFKEKVDAHWARVATKAEESGQKVLGEREQKKLFPYGGPVMSTTAGYVDLDARCYEDEKARTYRKILGKNVVPDLVRDPSGGIHQVVPQAEIKELLKDVGVRPSSADASQKRARDAQKRLHAQTDAIVAKIVERLSQTPPGPLAWLVIVDMLASHGMGDAISHVVKRREWRTGKEAPAVALRKQAAKLTHYGLQALLFELVLARDSYGCYSTKLALPLVALAKQLGINTKKMLKLPAAKPAKRGRPPKQK